MGSAQGIRAGRAYVELGVNDRLKAGLNKARTELKAFANEVQSLSKHLLGIGAAFAAPLAASLPVFLDYEKQMSRVKALTGANEEQFMRLSREARRLGETTVFTAGQAAEAMSFFALAGFKVDQIMTSLEPTLNLAAAGQLEIAQAADISAKIMAGMGIEASRLGYAVDVLTKAMTTANTDLVQLGDAMKYVGPVAKVAGISFEETTAAIQLLSNAGIQGQMAGTTLRGAILALTDPSAAAADELRRMGVVVRDARGNMRPLADIIGDMASALDGVGTADRLGIIGRIFDARQAAGFAELLDQGADKLRQFTSALKSAAGTAARIAKVLLDTLGGDWKIFTSAVEEGAISLVEVFRAPLRAIVNTATQAMVRLNAWIKVNKKLLTTLALAVAGIAGLGAAMLGVLVVAKLVTTAVSVFALALAAIKILFVPLLLSVATLNSLLVGLVAPLGLVKAGLAAFFLYSATKSKAGEKAIAAFGSGLRTVGAIIGELKSTFSDVFNVVLDLMGNGQFEAAGKAMWAGMELVWLTGMKSLSTHWGDFMKSMTMLISDFKLLFSGSSAGAEILWTDLKTNVDKAVAGWKVIMLGGVGPWLGKMGARALDVWENPYINPFTGYLAAEATPTTAPFPSSPSDRLSGPRENAMKAIIPAARQALRQELTGKNDPEQKRIDAYKKILDQLDKEQAEIIKKQNASLGKIQLDLDQKISGLTASIADARNTIGTLAEQFGSRSESSGSEWAGMAESEHGLRGLWDDVKRSIAKSLDPGATPAMDDWEGSVNKARASLRRFRDALEMAASKPEIADAVSSIGRLNDVLDRLGLGFVTRVPITEELRDEVKSAAEAFFREIRKRLAVASPLTSPFPSSPTNSGGLGMASEFKSVGNTAFQALNSSNLVSGFNPAGFDRIGLGAESEIDRLKKALLDAHEKDRGVLREMIKAIEKRVASWK